MKIAVLLLCIVSCTLLFAQSGVLPPDPKPNAPLPKVGPAKYFQAACDGNLAVVQQAIADGNPVDVKSIPDGYTPFLCAARGGHLDVLQFLLSKGADPTKYDNSRFKTPLQAACYTSKNPKLCTGNCEAAVAWLLTLPAVHASVNVNHRSINGWTALMDAAWVGDLKVVQALVIAGADWRMRAPNGQTALDLASTAYANGGPVKTGDSNATKEDYLAVIDYLRGLH